MTDERAIELLKDYAKHLRQIERAGASISTLYKHSATASPDIAALIIDKFNDCIIELSGRHNIMRRGFALLLDEAPKTYDA